MLFAPQKKPLVQRQVSLTNFVEPLVDVKMTTSSRSALVMLLQMLSALPCVLFASVAV